MKRDLSRTVPREAFDKKYFSTGNYEEYKKVADQWVAVVARHIRKSLADIARPRVLDVGCAYGYLLAALQDAGCNITGIEYSSHAIQNAEKAVRRSIHRGDILRGAHLRTRGFDAVICLNVVEYIGEADIETAIGNLVRWSGNFIFFTTCFTHSRYASQKYSPDPFRTTIKTQEQWKRLFAKSGARYVGKFYDGGGGDVLIFKKTKR